MALINFNSTGQEAQSSFEPIPNDWYNVIMIESEMKPTKAGDGAYLECQLKVVDGDFANRLLWLRLNIDNQNEVAQEIAYKQLTSICNATGVVNVGDSSELHGKPFQVKVTVRPPQGEYDASNEIKGFKACAGGASSGTSTTSTATSDKKPAWASKKPAEKKVEEKEAAADTTVEKTPEKVEETKVEETASAKPPWMS